MQSFYPLVLLAVGATATTFPGYDVSFGISRRQPLFWKRQSNNSKPSDSQSTRMSSILSMRGGAFDPYIGDIYYSEVIPENNSKSEESSYIANYATSNNSGSPIVSSSQVLYEGGCFVSSDSIGPVESMFKSFFNGFDDNDDEDDDNDDDDNDGHSSMLANGSLTQSRRMQSTTVRSTYSSYDGSSGAVYLESEVQFQ